MHQFNDYDDGDCEGGDDDDGDDDDDYDLVVAAVGG